MTGRSSPDPHGVTPFRERAGRASLDDLRQRLRATRWPRDLHGAGWDLGVDLTYLRELMEYWASDFDWPAREAALADLPRYHVTVGGLRIHVVHAAATGDEGSASGALPLLLCHGWPDNFWRFTKVLPLLTDPAAHGGEAADAFTVVVPDMPGFGYSDSPPDALLNSVEVADLWAELMTTLGHDRFAVAGGDIGSAVARYLALNHSDRVVAVHRTDAGVPVFTGDPAILTADERQWLSDAASWNAREGAYAAMHRTKPQTVAVGLTDSPAGLAAWVVEKLRSWSDSHGDLESSYTKDEILTLVTLYWLTGSIASSMRMYAANATIPPDQHLRRVPVPSGYSFFPADLLRPPEVWLRRTSEVAYVGHPPRGGHFAPFEEPELYVEELRTFLRPYRGSTSRG